MRNFARFARSGTLDYLATRRWRSCVTLLLIRRLGDPRIRAHSKTSDIVLLVLLWA
jgi:nitrate reductase gamma subunit